jgi:hypothetical protein
MSLVLASNSPLGVFKVTGRCNGKRTEFRRSGWRLAVTVNSEYVQSRPELKLLKYHLVTYPAKEYHDFSKINAENINSTTFWVHSGDFRPKK